MRFSASEREVSVTVALVEVPILARRSDNKWRRKIVMKSKSQRVEDRFHITHTFGVSK